MFYAHVMGIEANDKVNIISPLSHEYMEKHKLKILNRSRDDDYNSKLVLQHQLQINTIVATPNIATSHTSVATPFVATPICATLAPVIVAATLEPPFLMTIML